MPLRISQAGVRGTVGRGGLTARHALDFGAAFAKFLPREGPVLLARDPRASSVMLREGLAGSLMAAGRDVIDLGLASTPVLQHTMRRAGAAGGVSIGASHNPSEWNALKFFGPEGAYLTTPEADELLDLYHLRSPAVAPGTLGRYEPLDAIDPYLDDLERAFDFDTLRRFRVVVDCSNGTSSPILARLNERHGFRFILINAAADGSFAHVPSTSARMVALQLAPLIVPLDADAGFLFDADSDRVGLATERGEPVNEELILPLAADSLLAGTEGKIVLTNLSTTSLNEAIAAKHGATVARVPVGRNAAADALGAYPPGKIALAGEGTGAVMIPKFRFVYDGIATMFTLLEMRAGRGEPFSVIAQALPRYEMLKEEIPLSRRRIPQMLETLSEKFSGAETNRLDGLRAELDGAWFHVRVSQTEPLVRAIAEAPGQAPRALFDEVLDIVRSFA